jgi:eukaryotic-like serine/threonine-protein kinase
MIDPGDLRDVFDRAASLPAQDRAAFLARACGENAALRQEVERLLAADARAGSLFSGDSSDGDSGQRETGSTLRADLAPGTRLGPYVLVGSLGAGGMGEVYKARDTRLDRSVAIKVLPADLVGSSEARQRFEREARAAAALAHAHICRLLDVGRHGDTDYLVMELLDGETLASRLQRGKLPLRQALTYGTQIAGALVVAHRAGIVHRDLKPGNIMLTSDGAVLLDFGLARQTAPIAMDARTATLNDPITRTGVILGTVQYMAPEQLQGLPVDARTDLFAFGAVLYEMVTGRRPFDGANPASVISNILRGDPVPLTAADALTPPALDRLVQKCLAKDPSERWQTASEVQARLEALQDIIRDGTTAGAPAGISQPAPNRSRRIGWLIGAGLAVVVGSASIWWTLGHTGAGTSQAPAGSGTPQRHLTRLTFEPGLQTDPTFSPDGRFIAYSSDKSGNFDIWVQPLAGGSAIQITHSSAQDTEPAWSPDGNSIVFRSDRDGGGLYLVPALGGVERKISAFGRYPSWSADGQKIRFVDIPRADASDQRGVSGIYSVSLTNDAPEQLLPDFTKKGGWAWIAARPDGRISFRGIHETLGNGFFTVSPNGTVISTKLVRDGPLAGPYFWSSAKLRFRWSGDGTALFSESAESGPSSVRSLWRMSVDPASLDWTGVERLTTGTAADSAATLSPDGARLAFSEGQQSERLWSFPFNGGPLQSRGGQPVSEDGGFPIGAALSPDGRTVAFNPSRVGTTRNPLWLLDLNNGHSEVIDNAGSVAWSHDGRQLAYGKSRGEDLEAKPFHWPTTAIAVRSPSGEERLVSDWDSKTLLTPCDWSPDGSALLVYVQTPATEHLGLLRLGASHSEPETVLSDPKATFWQARYSPNGRWVSFVAFPTDGSASEIGVIGASERRPSTWVHVAADHVSPDKPRWSADGKRLYFLSSKGGSFLNLWSVEFDPDRGVPVGQPVQLSHFDSPGFIISPRLTTAELGVSSDRVLLTMRAATGAVWMLDNVDR